MANAKMIHRQKAILLSASIPTVDSDPSYAETADVIAIRDCIKALVAAAVPRFTLVWGGHPSITPMIRLLAEANPEDISDRFKLYQSLRFKSIAPRDNEYFKNIVWVKELPDEKGSLLLMRRRMITESDYSAAVFIGGMHGIEDEFEQFREQHPAVPVFPIASTGGASSLLYRRWKKHLELSRSLTEEIAYPFLWRELLAHLD